MKDEGKDHRNGWDSLKSRRRKKIKKKLSEKARPKAKKVRFNLYAPEAKRVFLAGDFNNWGVDRLPMRQI